MGKTLMGGQTSGTPMETRGGTEAYSKMLQQIMGGNTKALDQITSPFFGLQNQALSQTLGGMNLSDIVPQLLASPVDVNSGLFAAMQPFEDRQMQQATSNARNIFGTMGGRFSRNVATAEAQARGELANQFALAREQKLLDANAQRIQALGGLLDFANARYQNAMAPFSIFSNYFQPGAPQMQEGLLPGLLSAGSNVAMGMFMRPKPQPTTQTIFRTMPQRPTVGSKVPSYNNWSWGD